MQKYKCHKEVEAVKIREFGLPGRTLEEAREAQVVRLVLEGHPHNVAVTSAWMEKHKPEPGGYYVVYAGGYASYSPADVFEDGYAPIDG